MVGWFKNKLKSEGECVYCMWVGLVLHYRRALSLTYNASLFVYYPNFSYYSTTLQTFLVLDFSHWTKTVRRDHWHDPFWSYYGNIKQDNVMDNMDHNSCLIVHEFIYCKVWTVNCIHYNNGCCTQSGKNQK